MRRTDLRLAVALAFVSPLSAFSQVPVAPIDLPKVIFCSGQCYAVDERGVRTTVTKGAVLREGQRLETGPGTYAQVKVGQAAELAVSERGRVSFDQKSVGGRDLVILDQGRIRMIAGEAMGKIEKRALELRTADGTFSLKGADIEVKRSGGSTAPGSNLTYLKVNNGDASLRNGQVQVALSKDAVQGVTGGKVVTGRTFSLNEVALPPVQGSRPAIGPGTTLTITPAPVAGIGTITVPVALGTLPTIPMVPILSKQSDVVGLNPAVPGTVPKPVKGAVLTSAAITTTEAAPATETLNTTLSVILAPTTTISGTTSLTTTTTTSTSTLSTTSLSGSSLTTTTCLSCSTLLTTSPTTTTTTTTTTSTGTLSTTKLTGTTLTLSSTSLLK